MVRLGIRLGAGAFPQRSSGRAKRPKASSPRWSSESAYRPCAPRPSRPCAISATTSSSAKRSRTRSSAPAPTRPRVTATPSTCSARAPAPARTPAATSNPIPTRSTRSRPCHRQQEAAGSHGHLGQTLGACIRATSPPITIEVMAELVPDLLALAQTGEILRPQLHRRRRGSRPAGTVARRDRPGLRGPLA